MGKRFYTLMSLFAAVILGATLFAVSDYVQQSERELTGIQEKLAAEKETLRVLTAEWSYLNRPDRLEQLTSTYLHLEPTATSQILTSAEELPVPVAATLFSATPTLIPVSTRKPVVLSTVKAAHPVAKSPLPSAPPPSFQNLLRRLSDDGGTTQ